MISVFLFTDIEGSTSRWERFRPAMAEALRRHDALLRAAIEAHEGRVFKTIGDAFCAVFERTSDAVAAALAGQRSLMDVDWSAVDGLRVRMAIHAGQAEAREGDYFGPSLNRVARLLAIGHGGHVLLSRVAAELARDALPAGATLRDCGLHGLKDLTEPERVFTLETDWLPRDLPALRSQTRQLTNIARQMTELIGRTRELEELDNAFAANRLVSIVGPGGIGKTRMAIQFAAERLERYPDGVWFLDLAPLADGALIDATLGALLGIKESTSDVLARALRYKRTLLVFDNCEHLIAPVANLVATLLHQCPGVTVLATSREQLRIAGEVLYALGPLDENDAVRLFVERARERTPGFSLDSGNAETVAGICRQLDGVALAIELAAARVSVLSVRQIDERLSQRFQLLGRGSRAALPRQQTLRALIDWSYDLLDPLERTTFARLGIFSGSFDLESALAVAGDDAFDALASLADKSLVATLEADGERRYRLLESTRAYALERLDESGEREAIARRHAETYRDFAERLRAAFASTDELQLHARGRLEFDNVRAALEWTVLAANDPAIGARTIAGLRNLWFSARPNEGRRWAQLARERLDLSRHPELVADMCVLLGDFLPAGPGAAHEARTALELFRASGKRERVADALRALSRSLTVMRELDEAQRALEEALEIDRSIGAGKMVANDRVRLASTYIARGEHGTARRLLLAAAAAFEECGGTIGLVTTYGNLGMIESHDGNVDAAIAYTERALQLIEQIGERSSLAIGHTNLGQFYLSQDRFAEAAPHLRAALDVLREIDDPNLAALVVADCALLALLARGAAESAARLAGFCDRRWEALGVPRAGTEDREWARLSEGLECALAPERLAALRSEGAQLSDEAALAEARKHSVIPANEGTDVAC